MRKWYKLEKRLTDAEAKEVISEMLERAYVATFGGVVYASSTSASAYLLKRSADGKFEFFRTFRSNGSYDPADWNFSAVNDIDPASLAELAIIDEATAAAEEAAFKASLKLSSLGDKPMRLLK